MSLFFSALKISFSDVCSVVPKVQNNGDYQSIIENLITATLKNMITMFIEKNCDSNSKDKSDDGCVSLRGSYYNGVFGTLSENHVEEK
jgi:hypothetical protein